MLTLTEQGLYCAAGDFHIDPRKGVARALITHAHSDHARPGSRAYLCVRECAGLLRTRLGGSLPVTSLPYGQRERLGEVTVSFHPAGHVLGAAQIRLEHKGEVWVVSGDYKTAPDPTCAPFEPVRCHVFLTESTFGLPVYRWPRPESVMEALHAWWRGNRQDGRASVLFAYSLGKAQRLLAGLDPSVGPVFLHDAVRQLLPAYEEAGVRFPPAQPATAESVRRAGPGALVIAPPATDGSAWLRSLGEVSTACASGWMLLRGTRRWRSADRGFPLSDHADWPGLLEAIRATEATRILVTHGYADTLARWLNENGWTAETVPTRFTGDREETPDLPEAAPVQESPATEPPLGAEG